MFHSLSFGFGFFFGSALVLVFFVLYAIYGKK